ncbi:eglS, partial [Symbiodinium natans]
ELSAFVKLLFWTDSGNILGLVPPSHPKGSGKLRLVSFITDDYPNSWQDEMEVEDDAWYHVTVTFRPGNSAVELKLQGVQFSSGVIPVNMLAMSSGPQLGVYSFEYSGSWPSALDVRVEEIHGFTRIP